MKLHVLMAQRKQRYEGEYGLEALAVMSEADQESNPAYLHDALVANREGGEFDACEIITFEMSEQSIRDRLFPARTPIEAKLVEA